VWKSSIVGMPFFFFSLLATWCLPTPSFFPAEEIADLILWHWRLLQFVTFVAVLFMYKRYTYRELIRSVTGKVFKMNMRVKVLICGGKEGRFLCRRHRRFVSDLECCAQCDRRYLLVPSLWILSARWKITLVALQKDATLTWL